MVWHQHREGDYNSQVYVLGRARTVCRQFFPEFLVSSVEEQCSCRISFLFMRDPMVDMASRDRNPHTYTRGREEEELAHGRWATSLW